MIQSGDTQLQFVNGAVEVVRGNEVLYFNKRPMYAFLKTALSITEFYDAPYEDVAQDADKVTASGQLHSPTGSVLAFTDVYEPSESGFKVSRTVTVVKNIDDYGFASKISFVLAASEKVQDYNYFAPTKLVQAKRIFKALQSRA